MGNNWNIIYFAIINKPTVEKLLRVFLYLKYYKLMCTTNYLNLCTFHEICWRKNYFRHTIRFLVLGKLIEFVSRLALRCFRDYSSLENEYSIMRRAADLPRPYSNSLIDLGKISTILIDKIYKEWSKTAWNLSFSQIVINSIVAKVMSALKSRFEFCVPQK